MASTSPKPQDDKTLSTGASEPDAVRKVPFEKDPKDGPSDAGDGAAGEPPDAAEAAGTKRKDGEAEKHEAAPGAVAPDELSTETDDGVS